MSGVTLCCQLVPFLGLRGLVEYIPTISHKQHVLCSTTVTSLDRFLWFILANMGLQVAK